MLEIPNEKFDFGTIPHSSTVVQQFWFKSVGTDTVKIERIRTGCDCATFDMEKNWLAPGDSMKVGFYWDSKRRTGQITRRPTIYSNIEGDPLQLEFVGVCATQPDKNYPISMVPFKFEFSKLPTVSVDSIAFTMTNHSDSNYTLSIVSYPFEECFYYLPESIAAQKEAKGYIKVNPAYGDQEFKRSLTVKILADDGTAKRFSIPINRKIFSN
ncbi:MAG: DUF1573 domain-containing protein [Candidatus Zixiibacteriota bacterium]